MIQIDIDMPEKCGLCPLFHAEHPMYCQGVKADSKKKIVAPYGQPKPNWCLLHEVTADEDTISRKQAIEVAMQYCPDDDGSCSKSDRDIRELLDDLENLPPSQPQRKKGRWIKKTIKKKIENDYSCSECGRHVSVMRGYDVRLVYPFCHCGAEMTEGEE